MSAPPDHRFTDNGVNDQSREVDAWLKSHLISASSTPNLATLNSCLDASVAGGLPTIATNPTFAKLLALQCRAIDARTALEFGTLGGYGALWLALHNPQLHVTTLEFSTKHAEVARANIKAAGMADRVTVVEGPALETLTMIEEEVANGSRSRFDLTYIDADKENNWAYFTRAVDISRKGALLYVDNVVRAAKIVQAEWQDNKAVRGSRELVEMVGADRRVDATCIQTQGDGGYDGFLMAIVN